MYCSLKPLAKFSPEQATTAQKFLSPPEEKKTRNETPSKETATLLEVPPEDCDSDSERSTEAEQGLQNWLESDIEPSERSESEVQSLENTKWMRISLISAAVNLDLVAFAAYNQVIVFERSTKNTSRLELSSRIRVPTKTVDDHVSSICVLPLASTRKSEASEVDWICIVVGTKSGYLHFYTERGTLIFTEHTSRYQIKQLRFGDSVYAGNQELTALTHNRVVVFEGLSLFTTLKTARNQIARGDKTVEELSDSIELNCHSIELDILRGVSDVQVPGTVKPGCFDQYVTAAHMDGEHAQISPSLPSYGSYFCATRDTFGAFLWNDTSLNSAGLLQDAYHAVRSQIASSVPSFGIRSWLGIGTSKKDQPQKTHAIGVRTVRMNARSSLHDEGRVSERICVAPGQWNLMAVADAKARVTLIETQSRTIVRVWKGYRDARCAWVESTGSVGRTEGGRSHARALFLVIFAPRRGLLEVWSMQNGPRVAAFNVDRRGRLFYVPPGRDGILVGTSATDNLPPNAYSTAAFLSSDGQITEVVVPFHLSALDASESTVHDENLLKEIKPLQLISADNTGSERFLDFIRSLRTAQAKRRFVDSFLQSSGDVPTARVLEVVQRIYAFQGSWKGHEDFWRYLQKVEFLLKTYLTLASDSSVSMDEGNGLDYTKIMDVLQLAISDFEGLCLPAIRESRGTSVAFPRIPNFHVFKQQFDLTDSSSVDDSSPECHVILRSTDTNTTLIGSILFLPLLRGASDVKSFFQQIFPSIRVKSTSFVDLFADFWLGEWNTDPQRFTDSSMSILEWLTADDLISDLALLEHKVRTSRNPHAALLLALQCRALKLSATTKQESKHHEEDMDADDKNWESMDDTVEWWELLAKHLSVLSLLHCLPGSSPQTVNDLLDKGSGFYREQVGIWVANGRSKVAVSHLMAILAHSETSANDDWVAPLRKIAEKLPLSLNPALTLCDCAWEFASAWFKDESRRVNKLQDAVEFLGEMSTTPRLQHGLALMIWDTFLRNGFERLTSLINDNDGHAPGDRLLRREVLVSENELVEYIRCVRQTLKILCLAVVDIDSISLHEYQSEDFVENLFQRSKAASPRKQTDSLSGLADRKRGVNYHLVVHHVHLATALLLQLSLGIRLRLDSIFDPPGMRALFESFHSHPLIPLEKVSDRFRARRQAFLERVTEAIGVGAESDEYRHKWKMAIELSEDWKLDVDALRIKEVLMLYASGYDREAEKLIPVIEKRIVLAKELLQAIGGRIKYLLEHDSQWRTQLHKKSVITQSTMEYIEGLSDDALPNFHPTPVAIGALLLQTQTILTDARTGELDDVVQNNMRLLKDFQRICAELPSA